MFSELTRPQPSAKTPTRLIPTSNPFNSKFKNEITPQGIVEIELQEIQPQQTQSNPPEQSSTVDDQQLLLESLDFSALKKNDLAYQDNLMFLTSRLNNLYASPLNENTVNHYIKKIFGLIERIDRPKYHDQLIKHNTYIINLVINRIASCIKFKNTDFTSIISDKILTPENHAELIDTFEITALKAMNVMNENHGEINPLCIKKITEFVTIYNIIFSQLSTLSDEQQNKITTQTANLINSILKIPAKDPQQYANVTYLLNMMEQIPQPLKDNLVNLIKENITEYSVDQLHDYTINFTLNDADITNLLTKLNRLLGDLDTDNIIHNTIKSITIAPSDPLNMDCERCILIISQLSHNKTIANFSQPINNSTIHLDQYSSHFVYYSKIFKILVSSLNIQKFIDNDKQQLLSNYQDYDCSHLAINLSETYNTLPAIYRTELICHSANVIVTFMEHVVNGTLNNDNLIIFYLFIRGNFSSFISSERSNSDFDLIGAVKALIIDRCFKLSTEQLSQLLIALWYLYDFPSPHLENTNSELDNLDRFISDNDKSGHLREIMGNKTEILLNQKNSFYQTLLDSEYVTTHQIQDLDLIKARILICINSSNSDKSNYFTLSQLNEILKNDPYKGVLLISNTDDDGFNAVEGYKNDYFTPAQIAQALNDYDDDEYSAEILLTDNCTLEINEDVSITMSALDGYKYGYFTFDQLLQQVANKNPKSSLLISNSPADINGYNALDGYKNNYFTFQQLNEVLNKYSDDRGNLLITNNKMNALEGYRAGYFTFNQILEVLDTQDGAEKVKLLTSNDSERSNALEGYKAGYFTFSQLLEVFDTQHGADKVGFLTSNYRELNALEGYKAGYFTFNQLLEIFDTQNGEMKVVLLTSNYSKFNALKGYEAGYFTFNQLLEVFDTQHGKQKLALLTSNSSKCDTLKGYEKGKFTFAQLTQLITKLFNSPSAGYDSDDEIDWSYVKEVREHIKSMISA